MAILKLSIPQIHQLNCRKATQLVMAGQGAGKTHGIGFRTANMIRYFPRIIGMVAANTYQQLTQSTMVEVRKSWKQHFDITEYDKQGNPNGVYVVGKQPPLHFIKYHEFDDYRGIISFRNGCVVFTASLDNYLAHEGKTIGWAELDETKDTKEAAVRQVVLARLRQKGLYYNQAGNLVYTEQPTADLVPYNPCVINTSPAEGTVDWLEDMFDLKNREKEILDAILPHDSYYFLETKDKAVFIYSAYWNAEFLPSNFFEIRKGQLTEGQQLKFIYGYPFSKTGGEYYDEFERLHHVKEVSFAKGSPSHLTLDFNLRPYMTLECFQVEETDTEIKFKFFDEFCYEPPLNTTESVCEGYADTYGVQTTDIFYYGDAMGTRGIEGFGSNVTRFDDVRKVLYRFITDDSDRTTRVNMGVNKRRNIMNKIFAGKMYIGHKKVTIEIDPKCVNLIRDCQYLKLGANGKHKEIVKDEQTGAKYEKLGHTSDAAEYGICYILEAFL